MIRVVDESGEDYLYPQKTPAPRSPAIDNPGGVGNFEAGHFKENEDINTALKVVALAVVSAWLGTPAAAQAPHAMPPSKGFDQLKPLVGEWEGQTADGKPTHVSYQLVSGGTALLERLRMGEEPEMVTVYTPDGDRLAVTHFCSAGNQPQMRTAPVTGAVKQFSFTFLRATNLASPAMGHMHHLTVTLPDQSHFTQEWTWQENGKAHTEVFRFTRKS